MLKLMLIIFLFFTTISANEKKAFINIFSNVENTKVFLDGKEIGDTPIKQYEVVPNKKIQLEAMVDKKYYANNLKTTIRVSPHNILTYKLKFEKSNSQIFFVGDDAELYLNGKFIKKLNDSNRLIDVNSEQNITIKLQDGYADVSLDRNITANTLNTIKYKLKTIPKDIRLYTSTINNLMWEDTKNAANTNINWEKANIYCQNLQFAHHKDFRLPTIEELIELYENKDEIYNGFGGKFYWSSTTYDDEYKVWSYSIVKNFDDGTKKTSIKEFENGRVRCVRDIKKGERTDNEQK